MACLVRHPASRGKVEMTWGNYDVSLLPVGLRGVAMKIQITGKAGLHVCQFPDVVSPERPWRLLQSCPSLVRPLPGPRPNHIRREIE